MKPPEGAEALAAMLALAELDLPAECVPGVRANLALLGEHWRNLEGFDPDASE